MSLIPCMYVSLSPFLSLSLCLRVGKCVYVCDSCVSLSNKIHVVFSATRSLCRKLSKRYDVNVSYLFFFFPFFFLLLINLKLRGRIVPFDRAIHVHPLSISLAISFRISSTTSRRYQSRPKSRWDLSYKNWQELVLAPFSRNAIHRAFRGYMHPKEVINGEAIFALRKSSPFHHALFIRFIQSIPRTSLILVHFFNRKVFRSKPI